MMDTLTNLKDLLSLNNPLTDPLFYLGKSPVSLFNLIQVVLAVLSVFLLAQIAKRFLKNYLLSKLKIQQGNREVIATLASYFIMGLGLVILLDLSGLNLSSLALLGGGLSFGIGFGFQDLTKNLLSGLVILIERKLKVGDYIQTDQLSGYIKEIGIRSTVIHTLDGGDIVIANSNLMSYQILNWHYTSYTGCLRLPVGVAYDSDPDLVTEILFNCAYQHPDVLHEPPAKVLLHSFGDNSLNFELLVWVNHIDREQFIKSELNFLVLKSCQQRGIVMPFPQRDLWVRNTGVSEALLGRPGQKLPDKSEFEQPFSGKMTAQSLKDLLKQISYFKDYTDLQIRRLIELGYTRTLSASEAIYCPGEEIKHFWIVLSGLMEISSDQIEGIEGEIMTLEPGEFFGAVALIFHLPCLVTIKALEPTLLFVIPSTGFQKLLQDHPEFAEVIVRDAQEKHNLLSNYQQQFRDLGLLNSAEKNANFWMWFRSQIEKLEIL